MPLQTAHPIPLQSASRPSSPLFTHFSPFPVYFSPFWAHFRPFSPQKRQFWAFRVTFCQKSQVFTSIPSILSMFSPKLPKTRLPTQSCQNLPVSPRNRPFSPVFWPFFKKIGFPPFAGSCRLPPPPPPPWRVSAQKNAPSLPLFPPRSGVPNVRVSPCGSVLVRVAVCLQKPSKTTVPRPFHPFFLVFPRFFHRFSSFFLVFARFSPFVGSCRLCPGQGAGAPPL